MAKHESKQATKSRHFFDSLNARSVTSKDNWCYRPSFKNGKPIGESEWGYIITLPYLPKGNTLFEGLEDYIIVRCKKVKKQFLLQIVPCCFEYRQYGMSSISTNAERSGKRKKSKKKLVRTWNIRNLSKRRVNTAEWIG